MIKNIYETITELYLANIWQSFPRIKIQFLNSQELLRIQYHSNIHRTVVFISQLLILGFTENKKGAFRVIQEGQWFSVSAQPLVSGVGYSQ